MESACEGVVHRRECQSCKIRGNLMEYGSPYASCGQGYITLDVRVVKSVNTFGSLEKVFLAFF